MHPRHRLQNLHDQVARVATFIGVAIIIGLPARADLNADRETIDAWLQTGKFDQATLFCREQISAAGNDVSTQAAYTAELVRVLAEQARSLSPTNAASVWSDAVEVGDRFVRRHSSHPQALLVTYQTAVARSSGIEIAARTNTDKKKRAQILRDIRKALRRWDAAAVRVETGLRAGGEGRGTPKDALGPNVLRSLRDRIRHAKAGTLLVRAALYSSRSDDRILACRQAIELLEQIAPNNVGPEWAETRVDLVRALRLREDARAVAQETERLLQGPALPRCIKQALQAERLRVAVVTSDWRTAERLLVSDAPAGDEGEVDCPEWAIAQLEALVALGSQRVATDIQADWNRKAREQLLRVNSRYSAYWRHVAEATLANSLPETPSDGGAEILSDLAKVRLQHGDGAGAIKALIKSAEAADAASQPSQAWRMRFEAAKLQIEDQRFQSAIVSLAQLSQSPAAPEDAERRWAEEAQLLAIKASALGVQADRVAVDTYRSHLNQFVNRWPNSAQANQVRFWLGRLYQAEGDSEAALRQFTQINERFDQLPEVVDSVGQLCRQLAARQSGESHRSAYDSAIEWLSQPRTECLADRAAKVWVARLQFAKGLQPMTSGLGLENLPPHLETTVRALQSVHANAKLPGEAINPEIDTDDTTLWDDLITGLGRQLANGKSPTTARIAETTSRRGLSQAENPTETQIRDWTLVRTQALLLLGDVDDARRLAAGLHADWPDQLDVVELRAEVLTAGKRSDREQAIPIWQQLVRQSSKASERWYRAKYGLARTHFELGNMKAAAKTIAMVRALYPNPGSPELAARFDDLARKIGLGQSAREDPSQSAGTR